jgi:dihydroflavonol-4-reductase
VKAFVTGSTGLLGSNLVNALIAAGYEVKALARSREKAEKLLHHSSVEIVVGDMENILAFSPQIAGSDVLFHTAAYVHETFEPGNHWPKLEKINIQGTLELFAQAEKYGVRIAIHTSSTSVLGVGLNGMPSNENTPPDNFTHSDPYARSKLLVEQAIKDFLKTSRMSVILILPSGLLGPQDSGPTLPGKSVIQILERKLPIIPPGGASMVDVRDVAAAMISAVECGRRGERYIVSNNYYTIKQLAEVVGKITRVPIPTQSIPYPLLNILAHISEIASRITAQPPMMSVTALRTMHRKQEVSAEKAIRELHATFRPFEETVQETINWFLANGYVQSAVRL